jgi:hypothetical chaperone protein
MNYLGLDFGTSNCVACAPAASGEIAFVPLEGESILLPTVLFVNRAMSTNLEVDEDELDQRVKEAMAEERRRRASDEAELLEILLQFDARNKPKPPVDPVRPLEQDVQDQGASYQEELQGFERLQQQYAKDEVEYQQLLKEFQHNRIHYETEQIRLMRIAASEESIRRSVRSSMQREISEDLNKQYLDQTFFDALKRNKDFLFGLKAINAYAEDPLSGFYLRSPKSFLGADIRADHQEFFVGIIAKILSHIKEKSEIFFNKKFEGVVIGRPVNYHGSRGELGNEQALGLMRQAAQRADFKDVKFFIEPVAATLTIDEQSQHTKSTLIVDIGGGTTDCSFLNYDEKSNEYHVLRSTGSRIGGTDFDETLAWNIFMPYFGRETLGVNGLPIPSAIIRDSIATRDLQAQIRFSKSGYELHQLIKGAAEPDKLRRLLTVQENQYQHKLIIEAERLKIGLSQQELFKNHLDFIEEDLAIQTRDEAFAASLKSPISSILKVVEEAIVKVGKRPETIYLTGGMSRSKQLILELQKNAIFSVPIKHLDSLSAVSQGLGLVAGALSERSTLVSKYLELGLAD